MVDVSELFRVRLTLHGPDDYQHHWYEGPWPATKTCFARISYWHDFYRDTRGEQWSVTGENEVAEMSWKPVR